MMMETMISTPIRKTALITALTSIVTLLFAVIGRLTLELSAAPFWAVWAICQITAAILLDIDRQRRIRDERVEQYKLVKNLKDPSRGVRLATIEKLRTTNWLQDGILRGADLSGIDLQGANLGSADLTGANLTGANLRGADLHWAVLRGATLTDAKLMGANLLWSDLRNTQGITHEQFSEVYILRRSRMPDGQRYDGCYSLRGDLDDAARDRIKAEDMYGLARWYEVSVAAYEVGQEWAVKNLPAPPKKK